MEYWDPARRRGVVFAFRGTIENEDNHAFVLAGLDAARRYRVHFQDQTVARSRSDGQGTDHRWTSVFISPHPLSSELVFIEEAK